jgi:NAD(P)-dependent dehydrogenase (short-subunit alcohol dehydrogenase family)
MAEQFARYPSLAGRAVFVSGGATGIGAALVEHFAAQGARVGFVDLLDDEAMKLAEHSEKSGYPKPAYRHCDLLDIAALRRAIAELAGEVGPFTILLNSAANDQRHTIEEVTPEFWDNRLAINLRHQFFAAQAIAPMMIAAGGGSIVNIGSASWHLGQGGMPAYVAAKAGVEGLTRGLARDLGAHKIRVNCIIPGWIMTERQLTLWLTPEAERGLMEKQCLKEKVYPADIARMALWLAADDSRLCSAQNFVVDGGWS